VHSVRRNRLTTKRATKLVWLFSNLRLVKCTQAAEQEQLATSWNELSEADVSSSNEEEGEGK